jgi:hypothetical protein
MTSNSGPHHLDRKDVPHLSESLLIGIERWRFVEAVVKEFLRHVKLRNALLVQRFCFEAQSDASARREAARGESAPRHQQDTKSTEPLP